MLMFNKYYKLQEDVIYFVVFSSPKKYCFKCLFKCLICNNNNKIYLYLYK